MAIRKVAFEFDPLKETGIKVPRNKRREALETIGEFVRDKVLETVGRGESPVSGGKWKRSLSPEYKKIKGEQSSATFANMELKGDMLDALEVQVKSGQKLSLQITGKEAAKADGHNNFSGDSKLPLREFIPKPDQTLKKTIWNGIKDILKEYEED